MGPVNWARRPTGSPPVTNPQRLACLPGASATPSATATGSSASQKTGTTNTIVIKNFMFSPDSLTVAPGAEVTVKNEDSVTHTLTDKTDQTGFNTGPVGPNQTKTFKAPDKAGTYAFFCTIHQYMTGTLVVR
jgi:plastocyanin